MKDLTLIMPVYNEEEIIDIVILDWIDNLRKLKIDFIIKAYNDGSKDNTIQVLNKLGKKFPELEVIDNVNKGHGPTILQGYKEANSKWVFQVDSDNEMTAEKFNELWSIREDYDFLLGIRENREQVFSRKIISAISRSTVKILYGSGVTDVNSPYRLMRVGEFKTIFQSISPDTFAPNIIISGMVGKTKMRIHEINIPIKFRTTGEVSIKKMKLIKVAIKSWWQTVRYII